MVLLTEQSGGCGGSDAVETAGGYCLMGWATGYCGCCVGLAAVIGCGSVFDAAAVGHCWTSGFCWLS